jgi:23S rRNA pseudouridine1911/1915/1917 synthase
MGEQPIDLQVEEGGMRLDKYLAESVIELSRSAAQRLIDNDEVTVNGEPVKASYKVKRGDRIVTSLPAEQPALPVAEALPLRLVYEDQVLLVVDKPAGMVVHPAPGHSSGTLVNALLAHYPELAGSGNDVQARTRPGIVHRLDRDTSGLILVAKNDKVRRALQKQFHDRQVRKAYLALVDGHVQPAWGRIEAPIGRDPHHRQRMAILPGGRDAVTEYHVLEQLSHPVGPAAGDYTLVEAEPMTGRTHQIRVHLGSIGHPVVGDRVYGRRKTLLPVTRQFLHARQLEFKHPVTGQRMSLEAPLADDLAVVLSLLRSA